MSTIPTYYLVHDNKGVPVLYYGATPVLQR